MANAFLGNKRFVVMKAETTPGTAVTPGPTDFDVLFEDVKYEPGLEFDASKKHALPDHTSYEDTPGARKVSFSGSTRLRTGTAVNSAPKMGKLLKGMGLTEAVEGTNKGISYSPLAAGDFQTVTAWIIDVSGGATPVAVAHKIVGAIADGEIGAAGVGKPVMVTAKFDGKYAASVDLDNAALTTLGVLTAPDVSGAVVLLNATCTIGGVASKISSFKLALGNGVQPEINSADATGFDFFGIATRDPKLTINPLKQTVALQDAYALAVAGTGSGAIISIAIANAIPWTLKCANAQWMNPKENIREGRVSWEMEFKLMANGTSASKKVADMAVESTWELLQGAKS